MSDSYYSPFNGLTLAEMRELELRYTGPIPDSAVRWIIAQRSTKETPHADNSKSRIPQ